MDFFNKGLTTADLKDLGKMPEVILLAVDDRCDGWQKNINMFNDHILVGIAIHLTMLLLLTLI